MPGFSEYLKENIKKNVQELKDLTKRDLFRKSEFNTLPRLAAYAGIAAGLVGYLFVPFPLVAGFALASMAAGFAIGSTKEPKQRLEYTALGSVTPFALPGAITGGIVTALQLGVMFAVKAALNIRDAMKSVATDRAREEAAKKLAAQPKAATAPVPEASTTPAAKLPEPAAPAFNAATEAKTAAPAPVPPAPVIPPAAPTP